MSEWMKYGVRRRDTAEAGVIAALREAGATVLQLTGRDVPDLLVGFAGQTHAVEVKTNRAKLKPGQARLAAEWRGSPIAVARTPAQARKLLALWRDRRPTLGTLLRAEHEALGRTRIDGDGRSACREGCGCGERGGGSWGALEAHERPPPLRAGKDDGEPA